MDGSSKIAAAIVGGVLFVVVAAVGYKEFDRRRAINEAAQVVQQFADEAGAAEDLGRRQQAAQYQHDMRRQADNLARRTLSSSQQCVEGAVVQVEGNVYTQVGSIQYPVRCSGRLADRPLR